MFRALFALGGEFLEAERAVAVGVEPLERGLAAVLAVVAVEHAVAVGVHAGKRLGGALLDVGTCQGGAGRRGTVSSLRVSDAAGTGERGGGERKGHELAHERTSVGMLEQRGAGQKGEQRERRPATQEAVLRSGCRTAMPQSAKSVAICRGTGR